MEGQVSQAMEVGGGGVEGGANTAAGFVGGIAGDSLEVCLN